MRVMVLGKATAETEGCAMPTAEAWAAMEQYQQELVKAGILIGGEGLLPTSKGVRISHDGKGLVVTDGPFAETKEVVAGYAIWEVKSMEEAVAWAKRCPLAPGSGMELRPIFTFTPEEVGEITSQAK